MKMPCIRLFANVTAALMIPATGALAQSVQETARPCTKSDYARHYDVDKLLYQLASPDGDVFVTSTHRGAWELDPDNSMAGFTEAYRRGDEIVEVDIRASSDNKLYLIHDDILNRVTDIPPDGDEAVNIHNTPSERLDRALLLDRFGNPVPSQKLVHFDDFLRWFYTQALCQAPDKKPVGMLVILDVKGLSMEPYRGEKSEQLYDLKLIAAELDRIQRQYGTWGWMRAQGLVIKTHLTAMPDSAADFEKASGFTGGNSGKKNWSENALFVINPENPGPKDNKAYLQYKDMPWTIGFELNRRYPGDQIDQKGWFPEFAKWSPPANWGLPGRKGRSIHDFLDANDYPEGRATAGQCCGVSATPEWNQPLDPKKKQDTKGYLQMYYKLVNVMTIDDPEYVNEAYSPRRNMSLFKHDPEGAK